MGNGGAGLGLTLSRWLGLGIGSDALSVIGVTGNNVGTDSSFVPSHSLDDAFSFGFLLCECSMINRDEVGGCLKARRTFVSFS